MSSRATRFAVGAPPPTPVRRLRVAIAAGALACAVSLAALDGGPTGSGGKAGPDGAVDLILYGDTRGGVLQDVFETRVPTSAKAIHTALAKKIGSGSYARERAVLFLGDAVYLGGCPNYWTKDFLPALSHLCPALCSDGVGSDSRHPLQFYPLIGDHETFRLPTRADDDTEDRCPWTPRMAYELAMPPQDDKTLGFSVDNRDCSVYRRLESVCRAIVGRKQTSHPNYADCAECMYQEITLHGNRHFWAFSKKYFGAQRFAPFKKAYFGDHGNSLGPTWYALDFTLAGGGGERMLRVLMLDSQTRPGLEVGGDWDQGRRVGGQSQLDWIDQKIDAMPAGALLVLVSHQPPASGSTPQRLYERAVRAAIEHGVRLVAIAGGHIHNFAQGAVDLRVGGCPPQRIVATIAGDGGARDLGQRDRIRVADVFRGMRIGSSVTVTQGEPSWRQGTDRASVAFGVLHVTPTTARYSVKEFKLEGSATRQATVDEKAQLEVMRAMRPLTARAAQGLVYETVRATAGPAWPDVEIQLDSPAPCPIPGRR